MPSKGQKNGYTIPCEWCGKIIYQTKTQYNKAAHHFCSIDCEKKFQHKQKYEVRKCEICGTEFEVSKKIKAKILFAKMPKQMAKDECWYKKFSF